MIALDDRGLLRVLVVFLIFLKSVFACALCSLQTPTVHVKTHFIKSENYINGIDFEWVFSKNFTDLTILSYDLNDDKVLDEKELKAVYNSLIDYIKPRNHLTSIKHYKAPEGNTYKIKFTAQDKDVFIKDGLLIFSYRVLFDLEIYDDLVVVVNTKDHEGYFKFNILPIDEQDLDFYIKENINIETVFYEFSKIKPIFNIKSDVKPLQTNDIKLSFFDSLNIRIFGILKSSFSSENTFFAIVFLSFISFIYGVLHATLPGHGKMLVGSYFLSKDKSYLKAFIFASKVGFIHIFVSFILTIVSLFLIENFIANKTSLYVIKINGLIILLLVLFMAYRKYKSKNQISCSCSFCAKKPQTFLTYQSKKIDKITIHKKSIFDKTSDFLVAFGAGGVPCPGTVLVFILAYNLGKFYLAFLSAFFISFGMSVVIFVSAIFASSIGFRFSNFRSFIEFFGLFCMFLLSLWMIFFVDFGVF